MATPLPLPMPLPDPPSTIPGLTVFLEELYTDPSVRQGATPEFSQGYAAGLSPIDLTTRISPITTPTTPAVPASPYALGFAREVGVAWKLDRPVGDNVRGVEIQRSTDNGVTWKTLGEMRGYFILDDNDRKGFAASKNLTYRMRAVSTVGIKSYFSAYTSNVSATTLSAAAPNADLTSVISVFAKQVQTLHTL